MATQAKATEFRPITERGVGDGLPCPICTGRTYRLEATVGLGRDADRLIRDRCHASTDVVREWVWAEARYPRTAGNWEHVYGPRQS